MNMADCPIFAPAAPKMPADRLGLRGTVKREYDQSSAERMTRNVDGEFNRLTTYYGCATVTFASLADSASVSYNIPVHGPLFGTHYAVRVFVNLDLGGLSMSGYVSADDRVTVVFQNDTGGAVQPASSFDVCVIVERYPVGLNTGVGAQADAGSAGGDDIIFPPIQLGSLVLTGYAPTITVGTGNIDINTTGIGSLVLTSYAPVLTNTTLNQTISTGFGNLNITGYAPTAINSEDVGDAVYFDDGTRVYRIGTITGTSSTAQQCTVSVWIRPEALEEQSIFIIAGASLAMEFRVYGDSKFRVFNAGSWYMRSISNAPGDGNWHHVVFSFDTDTNNYHFYVDDVEELDEGTSNLIGSTTFNFQGGYYGVGSTSTPSLYFRGGMYQFAWWDSYINLSVESNRRKFIDGSGGPVDIGSDGSTAMGVAAKIHLHYDSIYDPVDEWLDNKGVSDEDFTEGNHTGANNLVKDDTSPS